MPPRDAPPAGLLAALAAWSMTMTLPPEAEREARLALVDTLACVLAGAGEAPTRRALAGLEAECMSGRSRPVSADLALPISAAALINGIAAHALDFDDYEVPGSTHPGAVLWGALLAAGETREVTLGALLRAHVAGYEAIIRFGEALGYGHYERGWHATATIGPIGAALAVAVLRDLPEAQRVAAMSLAASMSAGLKRQFGTDAKPVHAGLATRAGVEAAMLAGAGIGAAREVIDGHGGFLALFGGAGSPGPAAAKPEPGEPPSIAACAPLRKPWPSCAYTHRAIYAALAIAHRPSFTARGTVAVEHRIPEPYLRVAGFMDPRTPAEARFSVRWCIAAALADHTVGPASLSEEALARPDLRSLLTRVRISPYPLDPAIGDMSPAAPETLRVELADGGRIEEAVADVSCGPARPMDIAAILAKFAVCGGDPEFGAWLLDAPVTAAFRRQAGAAGAPTPVP